MDIQWKSICMIGILVLAGVYRRRKTCFGLIAVNFKGSYPTKMGVDGRVLDVHSDIPVTAR